MNPDRACRTRTMQPFQHLMKIMPWERRLTVATTTMGPGGTTITAPTLTSTRNGGLRNSMESAGRTEMAICIRVLQR